MFSFLKVHFQTVTLCLADQIAQHFGSKVQQKKCVGESAKGVLNGDCSPVPSASDRNLGVSVDGASTPPFNWTKCKSEVRAYAHCAKTFE